MKKRLLAAVLCLVMLLSCVPSFAFQAQASELPVITCSGSAQSAVSFPRNERITLTAEGGAWYQWQIKVNDSLWVNISGETGETLDVSYAMIANLCQGDTAYLRVVADGERYSDPVAVTADEAKIKTSEEPAAAPVILAAPQVVVSNPSTDSSAADSANTEAVAQAQAALTAAEAAANAAAEIAIVAEEDAAAKQAAYYEAQNKADAAKAAMDASAVTTEIPAETSAEDLDENGNPVVVKPAETVVTYDPDLQAAYAAAQAEADAAWQVYSEAAITLADAEANLEAAQAAVEAAAELEAAQSSQTELTQGDSTYDVEPTLKKYVVEIRYVFGDGRVAAPTWTGTYSEGFDVSEKVPSPAVLGYAPDQETVSIDLPSIQENKTYYVTYTPALVDYKVLHYQQNVDNDDYTLVATVSGQKKTGTEVSYANNKDLINSYDGFYVLPFETVTIAADGSTKIEIKYDRLYYLMNFDLDGGYDVEPIYARYGAPISVSTPTKAGYSFSGWTLEGVDAEIPGTMPAANRTYKAVWTPGDSAKVSVVFWGENADDTDYSYIRTMQVDAKPGENYTFDGSTLTCPLEEHNHDKCNLVCTHTTHTLDCYSTNNDWHQLTEKPSNALTDKGNGIWTYTTSEWWGETTTHYYLNIGDKWYCGTDRWGNADDTKEIRFSCAHSHTDACYSCGQIAHTHGSACSNLWEFVSSETVTVAANGSSVVNVYYRRTTFTIRFVRNGTAVKTIADTKWGADIHANFPIKDTSGNTIWWTVPSGCQSFVPGNYLASINTMPAENITFAYHDTEKGAVIYYYVETIDGAQGVETFPKNSSEAKNFNLYKTIYLDYDWGTSLTYTEEFHDIIGFKQWWSDPAFDKMEQGGSVGMKDVNYLCYARNSFAIEYYNPTGLLKTDAKIPYEKPLSTYYWEPTADQAPAKYAPGSVQFDGWYLNPECTGEEFDFATQTMPAGPNNVDGETALSLYAKWVPVTHTVKFYQDKKALDAGTELSTHSPITVAHGNLATPTPSDPENGEYNFVAWFYLDENGVEKAFDFAHMPVTKDMNVYGKWSSDKLVPYYIYYKLEDGTEIAAPTTGDALAGNTKTFYAKGGDELYPAYKEGFFPKSTSRSITMDINGNNVYTFVYVEMEAVPYTVKYLNKETGEELLPSKTVEDNRMAVVTETYVKITGYLPDAYQKRLEVGLKEDGTPDTENNVIIFYYTADTEHAYWTATHYTENLDKDAQGNTVWTEYRFSESVGDIGQTYSADPMTIPGFTYDSKVTGTVTSGELTNSGLDLKLYYTRNSYPYEVRYLEEGTGKQLAEPKKTVDDNKVEGRYGQSVSEDAIAIPGYTAKAPTTKLLNIDIETGDVVQKNIITFYYTENEATIKYEVVGPTGCGSVYPTSETLKALTGTAQGSTATASSSAYKFVGWYGDKACTEEKKLSTDAKYTPTKADGTAWVDGTTYYAKFEYDLTTLTITKSGAVDANDGFIFDVVGSDGTSFTVSVKGEGSVTIAGVKVGTTYTITERASWSWRYAAAPGEITLDADSTKNEVTITNSVKNQYLLDGSAYARNNSVLSNTAK